MDSFFPNLKMDLFSLDLKMDLFSPNVKLYILVLTYESDFTEDLGSALRRALPCYTASGS